MPRGGVSACSPLSPADIPCPTGREPHTWSCVCCLHLSSPGGQGNEQGEPRLLELPVPSSWIPDGNGTEGRWHRGLQREEEQRFGVSHLHVVASTKLGPCILLVWFWGILVYPQTTAQGSQCVRLQTGAVVWGPWGKQQRSSE